MNDDNAVTILKLKYQKMVIFLSESAKIKITIFVKFGCY